MPRQSWPSGKFAFLYQPSHYSHGNAKIIRGLYVVKLAEAKLLVTPSFWFLGLPVAYLRRAHVHD